MKRYIIPLILSFFAVVACAESEFDDRRYDEGVSKELAVWRKATINDLGYELYFDLVENRGVATLIFSLDAPTEVIIDFRPTELVESVRHLSHNAEIDYKLHNEHIVIAKEDVVAGENRLSIEFDIDNQSLNRRDDFLYTLLVPDRARTLFPCFDQPDLKASYRLTLRIAEEWVAVSNTAVESVSEPQDGCREVSFAPTEPLSTYLFSFVAGEFEQRTYDDGDHRFTAYYRETDERRLAQLDTIFSQVASSLEWMEEYTGIDYPFAKYDFVILPGFQYGGMEHTGATLYNDTQMFLSDNPTPDEELRRIQLIAHETAHMWFGDYVTMEWFDDVWTKEVFANYFAARITEPLFPDINHRLSWVKSYAISSLSEDRTLGTTSIRQPLDNLRNAGLVYGNIIYNKAPIMLEKLVEIMGEDAFRKAIGQYLRTYAYGNATWDDIVAIFDSCCEEDIASFSRVWVNEKGMPHISFDHDGTRLVVAQHDIYDRDIVWPQRFDILAVDGDGAMQSLEVELMGESATVALPRNTQYVLPNSCGRGYGHFLFDANSREWLIDNIETIDDDTARMSFIVALYESYDSGVIDHGRWLDMLCRMVEVERNALVASVVVSYMAEPMRVVRSEVCESYLLALTDSHPLASCRKQLLRMLWGVAEGEECVAQLYDIWERGDHPLLSVDDYISLSYELAIRYPDRYDAIVALQRSRLADADRRSRFDYIVRGATSDTAALDALFEELLVPETRRTEPWAQATLQLINHPLRGDYSVKYLRRALEELSEVQRTGDIFFPRNWAGAAISSHRSEAAYDVVCGFLEDNPDYPELLKNKILQASHQLYRANRE